MPSRVAIVLAVVLVAAGCGVRNSNPFTAKSTAPCLVKKGFTGVTTKLTEVGFIAGFADHGGLKATSPAGNTVTIAFTASPDAVASTEQAFRTHAPPAVRPHIADIMSANRNAVLVWTTTPSAADLDTANRCLEP